MMKLRWLLIPGKSRVLQFKLPGNDWEDVDSVLEIEVKEYEEQFDETTANDIDRAVDAARSNGC